MVQVDMVHVLITATPEAVVVLVVVRVGRAEHNPHTYSRPAVETTVDMEGRVGGTLVLPQV